MVRRIAWIFSVEFLSLGMVAGLMGSLLAAGFAALVLTRLLQIECHLAWVTQTIDSRQFAYRGRRRMQIGR